MLTISVDLQSKYASLGRMPFPRPMTLPPTRMMNDYVVWEFEADINNKTETFINGRIYAYAK